MAEPGKVEGVDDGDLASATSALLRIPDLRAEDPERFAQSIRALVERRAQTGWPGEGDGHDVAAFVMVGRPREFQARFSSAPITDPASTNQAVLGNVLLLTRDGAHGQFFPMPCDHNALLDWLADEGLSAAPLIMAYRPSATMSVRNRGSAGDVTREDAIRSVPPVATLSELREALEHFRISQLLTPMFCERGVWEPKRAASYVPGLQPERSIQIGLGRALNSWFHGVVRADFEDSTRVGRIDVKLMIKEGEKPLAYWAILELKVIKSFANATGKAKPTSVGRSENVAAVLKGLQQAWAYRANSQAEHGLLEVYDMRQDKADDLFADANVKARLAKLVPVPEYAVRSLYGSADDARLAGETGV